MKKLLLASVLAASSVFTVTACTSVNATTDTTPTTKMQKQHKAGMKKGEMRGPLSKLDLTAAQQTQIKAIMEAKHSNNKADRTKHQAERAQMDQQMQALTNASTLNSAAVNRLADQQAAKTKQRFIERVQTQHAIAQVLTAEQRAKLAQMKEDRKGDDEGRRGPDHREQRGDRAQQGM
ncbi:MULTISPECIES: Spy/CpxP family protein refolding chaperone [unclassified Psychrobacter]|uniref:Spy/CpxP family protein refolding chaperone n=1 Tax=unclassified Psychrobacter TaxID=196806 RepID=UPI0018CEA60E|nr:MULTISPECIES: Spy/CpxP family protein refolding chaperone [unclassified Psychrobacter]MBH0006090.1 Spy/CpxP family protein refolding chaperone [Psychrobacter sp. SWN149]MBI0425171.1 Spy/CpxP family protein refolding chaperone [Psychrobacter sp. NG27]